MNKIYLGDGVYAEYQACSDSVCVSTHRLNSGEHFVHLDMDLLLDLVKFLKDQQESHHEQLLFAGFEGRPGSPDRMETDEM